MKIDRPGTDMEKVTDEEHMNDPIEAGEEIVPKRVGNKDLSGRSDEDYGGSSGTMSYDEFYG